MLTPFIAPEFELTIVLMPPALVGQNTVAIYVNQQRRLDPIYGAGTNWSGFG
jgi:hypothetical protein